MDVKLIRSALMLTQKELAEKLGVHLNSVQNWERNVAKPSLKHQRKILELLKESGVDEKL